MGKPPFPDDPREYLRPPSDAFWRWDEQGEEVEWSDGRKVITFRSELRGVLARQAERGLPPLGAVLLVLAAVRESWQDSESEYGLLAGIVRAFDDAAVHLQLLSDVHAGLDRIRKLSSDLRNSAAAKGELVDMIFDACRERTSPATTAAVLQLLDAELPEEIRGFASLPLVASWWHLGTVTLQRDLEYLKAGLSCVDEDRLRLRVRTGLDAQVLPAPIEPSPAELAAALIQTLRADDELGGLARIAHDLMAAATLPRHVSQADELHLGGISDISNRGPLDRLLLSELAHDDLTLSVRVAMNEALYLRRESPPRSPPRTRSLLLDCGLRSWGVPRVFSTAVALALTATTDRHDHVCAWRANGRSVEQVELTTRQGVTEHLERLTTTVHPGEALPHLLHELAECDGDSETIIVTTDDTFADAEFQRALADVQIGCLYLASVNREGEFRLSVRSRQGQKLLRHAELDLEKLLANPSRGPRTPLVDRDAVRNLPAIFACQPFPLRLPHAIDYQQLWPVDDAGAIAATSDQRLMGWGQRGCGAFQFSDRAPRGVVLWHSRQLEDRVTHAVIGPQQSHRLWLVTLRVDESDPACHVQPLKLSQGVVRAVADHNGALLVIFADRVEVFPIGDIDPVASIQLPKDVAWQRDRFFQQYPTMRWMALAYDGLEASLEPVLSPSASARCPKLVGLFDRFGHDGPWGVTSKGDLYDTASDQLHSLPHQLDGEVELRGANRTGNRICLRQRFAKMVSTHQPERVVDVERQITRNFGFKSEQMVNFDAIAPWVSHMTLRHRFQGAALDDGLVLVSRKGISLQLTWDAAGRRIYLSNLPKDRPRPSVEKFSLCDGPEGAGYRLMQTVLYDGTNVNIDSRGLLHLRTSDPTWPEVTLVLNETHMAGWCSHGGAWGLKFFTGNKDVTPPPETCRAVLTRFVANFS